MIALEEMLNSLAMKAQKMASYGVNNAFDSVMKGNENTAETLQADQMFSGKRADNSDIKPSYAESTIKTKRRKGQPFNRVTLRDTRAFHDAIEAKYSKSDFAYFVTSTNFVTKYLVPRYRADIFGLNDTFLGELLVLIRDEAIEEVAQTFRTI